MNNQEVIDEIKKLQGNAVSRSHVTLHPLYADGVADTCSDVIKLVKQLDEPQKVKVPAFVVEYINWCKQHDWQLTAIATTSNAEYFESHSESSGLHEWINENYATFLIAIATDDFEVEEKLKFIVKQKDGFYIEGLAKIEGKTYAKTFDSEAEAYKWAELCSGMIEKV